MSWFLPLLLLIMALPIQAQSPASFRVMTFNIRYDSPEDGINRWDNRKDWVAELIRFYNPEIFGLQEAMKGQIDDLTECLAEWDWVGAGRDDGRQAGEFCPVFFRKDRWKLLDWGTFWLSETPEKAGSLGWDASLPRVVTWVKLQQKATGREAWFLNTHFDHRGPHSKQEGALLILRRMDEVLRTQPTCLMGDLNTLPGSMPYQLLEGSMLDDTRFLSQYPPYGPEGTYNGFQLGSYGGRIDYLFVNDFWKVRQYVTIADHLDRRHPSDHFPVLVEMTLQ